MRVDVKNVPSAEDERVVLECVELTEDFRDIREYALMKGNMLTGYIDDAAFQLGLPDVIYFEAVGELVFAYTENEVYEIKSRLYEIEQNYSEQMFMRCSKSIIANISKIESFRPAPDTRLIAKMKNGEEIVISRMYAKSLKQRILEG
ncbi:MAG: LytTR family transcriptional regulator DNA-binding domain-containing protein [Oscillospiraceae bacterium]|nr:LytTR family transcriptional regulator DNA-binding domain-containing protein [Oscillospiraceae bacterium]